MNAITSIYRRVMAWLWPERCIFCGSAIPSQLLSCETCREEISVIRPPICARCGNNRKDCKCRSRRHRYDRVAAPFYCNKAVYSGILRLKRRDDPLAIRFFAEKMAAVVRREFGDEAIDAVTYIPMTASDRRKRGYNQGELLAKAVAKQLELPMKPLLVKCYQTKAQKSLTAAERSGNVLGAFDVCESVEGKTILLIDDVITTGATTDECAKMLKLYGASRVLCVTIAVRRQKEDEEETE